MSPLKLSILIHYYAQNENFAWNGSDAHNEAEQYFIDRGYIKLCAGVDGAPAQCDYVRTEKLEAYISALCEIPEPVQKWIIPSA